VITNGTNMSNLKSQTGGSTTGTKDWPSGLNDVRIASMRNLRRTIIKNGG